MTQSAEWEEEALQILQAISPFFAIPARAWLEQRASESRSKVTPAMIQELL